MPTRIQKGAAAPSDADIRTRFLGQHSEDQDDGADGGEDPQR
ncbi:hypothetical protein ABZY45_19555 [Streptomyces sp. NPDC006516]